MERQNKRLTKKEVRTVLDLLGQCDEDQTYLFAGFLDAHKFRLGLLNEDDS